MLSTIKKWRLTTAPTNFSLNKRNTSLFSDSCYYICSKKKMKNIFEASVSNEIIDRINRLTPTTKAQWGKMNVSQMLAHCNVTYELVYDSKHAKPGGLMKF